MTSPRAGSHSASSNRVDRDRRRAKGVPPVMTVSSPAQPSNVSMHSVTGETKPVFRPVFVLASASPRRLDLLRQIGIEPDRIDPPEIDESHTRTELPRAYARRMAAEKLAVATARHPGAVVIAADTVVACGRRILPKAEDVETARACLALLSGRRHRVWGGI